MFMFFVSVTIILGLIYASLQKQSNEILSEIREFKREMNSFARGNQRSLDVFQKEIETLKEMVGDNK